MAYKFGLISLGSVSSKMVLEEAKKYFDVVDHIDIRKIEIKITGKKTEVLYDGDHLKEYDCLYVKGSYKYMQILYAITEIFKGSCYIPIDSNAHLIAHDKFLTHLHLSMENNLPMPETYFAAKISETKEFLKTLNYPMILKLPTGTHGKGVIFTDSAISAKSMVDALDIFKQPVIVQDYVDIKSDIRIIVAGDKIIGSMKRIASSGEIRANAHQGGEAEAFVVTPKIKQIALEAARKLKADVCAVDIIESDYGPLILEINTSPGLQKITEVTKKNIADEIAKFLYEQTEARMKHKEKVQTKGVMSTLGVEDIGSHDFEAELKVTNGKIVLPEFVHKMSSFRESQDVVIKVSKNKIEIVKE